MEAKLKALKVADLKEILTKSSTPIPSKANKADLIAKILATPDALKLAGGDPVPATAEAPAEAPAKPVDDDLLAPPDEFDWDGTNEKPEAGMSAEAKPAAESVPAPATEPTPATTTAPTEGDATKPAEDTSTPAEGESKPAEGDAAKPVDEELERRKARAARFGVPLIENPVSTKGADGRARRGKKGENKEKPESKAEEKKEETKKPEEKKEKKEKKEDKPKAMKISAKEAAPNDDDAKLAARAARFGITNDPKPAAGASSDPADEDKKKKREARFGAPASKKAKTEA